MSKQYHTHTGERIQLGPMLGVGGEGKVYDIDHHPDFVVKMYHSQLVNTQLTEKLTYMLQNPPEDPTIQTLKHVSITWPTDLIYEQSQVIGYVMPKLGRSDELYRLIQPQQRKKYHPAMNHQYIYRAASNLARAVDALHAKGYVVGDMNERNVLFTNQALVSLIDCDSMQVTDTRQRLYTCKVGVPELLAPELHGCDLSLTQRTVNHDNFTLALLLFKMLMQGFHPFQGRPTQGQVSGEQSHLTCMQQGIFPYIVGQSFAAPPVAPPLSVLPGVMQQQFMRAFTTTNRPAAREWVRVLSMVEQRLVVCANDVSHRHPSDGRCVICEAAQNVRTHGVVQTQVALPPPRPAKKARPKPSPQQVPQPTLKSYITATTPQPLPSNTLAPTLNQHAAVTIPPSPRSASGAVAIPVVVSVAAAALYSVAVRQDGSVSVWGDAAFQRMPTILGPVHDIYASQQCIAAVCRDGSVVSWGPQPISIPTNLPEVSQLAIGRQGCVAVTRQQQLIMWDQSLKWREITIPHVVAVAMGSNHTVVLDRDGNARAWGDNSAGQTDVPMDTPVYRAVFAGHNCTMAIRKNKSLQVIGGSVELQRYPVQARQSQIIVIGTNQALATTTQGELVTWGDMRHPASRIPNVGSSRFDAVAMGDAHMLALRRDGKILAWGKNDAGQCDVPKEFCV